MKEAKKKDRAPGPSGCEFCEYYDYNEETEQYECVMDLDQDELSLFLSGELLSSRGCRYFKFYDEYKSVQKQN